MRFEKMTVQEAFKQHNTKFVIHDANSATARRQVFVYDDLVFKYNESRVGYYLCSYLANFVICELSFQVRWNSPNITVDTVWKVHKANVPPMPDWFYLRPCISKNFLKPSTEKVPPIG
jgi:hypothetical protein